MNRSTFIAAGLVAIALPLAAFAQTDWPQKPVTMVVPYPPGGVNDAVARIYANKLAAELGKPMLIDNRAGAGHRVVHATRRIRHNHGHRLLRPVGLRERGQRQRDCREARSDERRAIHGVFSLDRTPSLARLHRSFRREV